MRLTMTLRDILCYTVINSQRYWSLALGTLALRLKAKLFAIELGEGVSACGPVILGRWCGSRISIGSRVSLISSSRRATASTIYAPIRLRTYSSSASIVLSEGVQLSGTSIVARSQEIFIGEYTIIAPNCVIVDSDFHEPWPAERRHLDPGWERDAPVNIGKHVWIGMQSLILKGVTIGDGAIVGAGSVVTRNIPAGAIVGGVPAKQVNSPA